MGVVAEGRLRYVIGLMFSDKMQGNDLKGVARVLQYVIFQCFLCAT